MNDLGGGILSASIFPVSQYVGLIKGGQCRGQSGQFRLLAVGVVGAVNELTASQWGRTSMTVARGEGTAFQSSARLQFTINSVCSDSVTVAFPLCDVAVSCCIISRKWVLWGETPQSGHMQDGAMAVVGVGLYNMILIKISIFTVLKHWQKPFLKKPDTQRQQFNYDFDFL